LRDNNAAGYFPGPVAPPAKDGERVAILPPNVAYPTTQ